MELKFFQQILLTRDTKNSRTGNNKNVGMNLEEVIEECKLFYFAGQDTTSVLLVWTILLLVMETWFLILVPVVVLWCCWKLLNWVWLRPKRWERYRLLVGDAREMFRVLMNAAKSQQSTSKKSVFWEGSKPKVIITDPNQIKEVFNKIQDFEKPKLSPIFKLLGNGLANLEGEKRKMHRKIINPAFHLENLKVMLPIFLECCDNMVSKWEGMLSSNDKCEIDVWPFLQNLTCDIKSRTAFGSSYEEGKRIFELLKEQAGLIMKSRSIINKRENAIKVGEILNNDLLGMLLESNRMEIQEHGNNKNIAITSQEVIEDCKAFYIAGQETTLVLLVWTMVLLSRYPNWQARAREEVLHVFGNQKPDYNGLSYLKIFARAIKNDVKLGNLSLPAGVQISLPILLIHQDRDIWGDDATEFNPERFAEGVTKATKGQVVFFPFGWGPRVCLGQNFALLEAKMVLSLLLQRFSFELFSCLCTCTSHCAHS
ncbi:11-oxo-beta-amyrin 30-oxidase [Glycine soja]